MRITPKETFQKNVNKIQAQGYKIDVDDKPVPDRIPNQETEK